MKKTFRRIMYLERHLQIMQSSPFAAAPTSLYLICDGETSIRQGISVADFVSGAVSGGAGLIQYRHKNISAAAYEENLLRLMKICEGTRAVLVVNDHAALAEKFSLTLHLGQGDALPPDLRVLYGRSTHNTAELATALAAKPAPGYIALGTMFPSPTKPGIQTAQNFVEEFLGRVDLPLVLIGGITSENVSQLPQSPRIFYAVIGDAFRFGATQAGIAAYVESWRRNYPR